MGDNMTVTSADFTRFYKQQREAIDKEKKTEHYGLTKTERLKLRRLLGYSSSETSLNKKSVEIAGAFTRQALKLNSEDDEDDENNNNNINDGEKNDEKNENSGEQRMGDVPRLFTKVIKNR